MATVKHQVVHIDHLWWNGIDRRSAECAFIWAGRRGDGCWVVGHTGHGRESVFDHGDDAVMVARHVALGWTRVPVSFAAGRLPDQI